MIPRVGNPVRRHHPWLVVFMLLAVAGVLAGATEPVGKLKDRGQFDLVVVGGTPAGICAAVAAARMGRDVALIEETAHLGGMLGSGLCHLDKRYFASVSGIIRQWCDRNRDYYLAHLPNDPVVRAPPSGYDMAVRLGTKFEPHIAEKHFGDLVAEAKRVSVFYRSWPVEAVKTAGALRAVVIETAQGARERIAGRQFIDATDEGDLAALAGVGFRMGREPRSPEEPHAGRIYTPAFVSVMGRQPAPPNVDVPAHWSTLLPGSDGRGDETIQAYTYVACLKNYAGAATDKHLLRRPPPGYDRSLYANTTPWSILRRWPETYYAVPNRKCQFHWAWFGSDTPQWSTPWCRASRSERQRLRDLYRDRMLGFIYYLQHEGGAADWGLADDEYRDNNNFPTCLYVREGRRIDGRITLTESDLHAHLRGDGVRPPLRPDSIAVGDWPMDSHAVAEIPGPEAKYMGEGTFFLDSVTPPFQVPWGVMVPRGCAHLLVPVACSATHVAFGALRVEQCRAAMGQAAGVAAAMAIRNGGDVGDLSVPPLQAELLRQGCVLYFYRDIAATHPAFTAIEQLSLRGAFRGDDKYRFRPDEPVTRGEAARAVVAVLEWPWSISAAHFRDCRPAHSAFRAVETLFDHGSIRGVATFCPDAQGRFRPDDPLGSEIADWLRALQLPLPQQIPAPLTRAALADLLWKSLPPKP